MSDFLVLYMKIVQTSKVKLVDLKIQYKKNNNDSDQCHLPAHSVTLPAPAVFVGGRCCRPRSVPLARVSSRRCGPKVRRQTRLSPS